MKKSLSLLLAIAMVFTMVASVAFAADPAASGSGSSGSATTATYATYTTQEKYDLLVTAGVFDGDADGLPHLDAKMTRAQFAKVLTKLKGLKEDAAGSKVYSDLDGAGWAAGFIGAVTKAGYMEGDVGKFFPSDDVTIEQLATVLVRVLKLPVDDKAKVDGASGWAQGYVAAAIAAKLIPASPDYTKPALRAQLVESGFAAKAIIDTPAATPTPSATPTPTPAAAQGLAITSAVALNSKVVEVTLNTAPATSDVTATNVTVKDSTGAAVTVSSVAVAPYSSDKKVVLVTLGADTKAGTLYTVTSGTKSANFGGRAADTAKPSVLSVTSTAYNEVTIKFNEAITFDVATITAAEKWGAQTALKLSNWTYTAKDTIVGTSDPQKDSTLYGISIAGVKDFAGNTMDTDSSKTFAGQSMPTGNLTVANARSNNPLEVTVEFNLPVDPSTLVPANFVIEEMWGNNAKVEVSAVRLATTDDKAIDGITALTDKTKQYHAVLTIGDTKASTLYKVTVSNLKTKYGYAQSSTATDTYKTFSGNPKPTDAFTFVPVSYNNTTVDVNFPNKMDKATAENIANYSIVETWGSKNKLEVKQAVLKDAKTVRLTVASMSNVLYSLTVTNVKDIYGNAVKNDSSGTVTFAGAVVQEKISTFTAEIQAGETTKLDLIFNVNLASDANDVSHYFIDNSIGYPSQAVVDGKKVTLTIPATTDGKIYNITVKNLNNSDGVAMDSAGVTKAFVGKGNAVGLPAVTGLMTLNNRKLEIFFDRAVDNGYLKDANMVWDAALNTGKGGIVSSRIKVVPNYSGATNEITPTAVYKDPLNANGLVLVFGDSALKANQGGTYNTLNITFNNGFIKGTDSGNTVLPAPTSETVAYGPLVTGVLPKDTKNFVLQFDQPINIDTVANANAFTAFVNKDGSNIVTSDFLSYNTTDHTQLNVHFHDEVKGASDNLYKLKFATNNLSDVSGTIAAKDDNTSSNSGFQTIVFPGTSNTVKAGINSGIYGIFSDKQTLTVYFPQRMDGNTITGLANANNITVDAKNGSTVTRSFVPVNQTYDASKMIATLYFDVPVVDSANANAIYSLKIAQNSVKSETGDSKVAANTDGTGDYTSPVSASATNAAGPVLSSATIDDSRTKITVNFNKDVTFNPTITGPTAGGVYDSTVIADQTNITNILKVFKITGTYGDGSAIPDRSLTFADVKTVKVNSASVEITLNYALKPSTNGTVILLKSTATEYVKGWNTVPNSSTDNSTVTFGVPATSYHDTGKPAYMSYSIDATKKVVTLNFDKNISNAGTATDLKNAIAFTPNGGVQRALTNGETVAVSNNTIVITFATALLGPNNIIDIAADAVKDSAGNKNLLVHAAGINGVALSGLTVGALNRVTQGKTAVAPVWNTGALTPVANGTSKTVIFNGVTVTLTSDPGGAVAAAAANATTATVTVADNSTAAQQALAIVNAFDKVKTDFPATAIANFTFAVSGNGVSITGTTAMGSTNNAFTITGTATFANVGPAQLTTAGVTAATEQSTVTISGTATASKVITVTVTNGGLGASVTTANIQVTAGTTTAALAAADIAAKLNAQAGFNATHTAVANGANITITNNAAGTIATGITFSINE